MAHARSIWLLIAAGLFLIGPSPVQADSPDSGQAPWTEEQEALIEFALGRFAAQGLELPQLEFVFRDSLTRCDGHKGRYYGDRGVIEMCSNDKTTLLHEMAHAWARANLTLSDRDAFVDSHGLDSWNDHAHDWERRGTEHVAETIAWGLLDDPHHVKWVETLPDGAEHVEHRILTVLADVETLMDDFATLTGMTSIFRHPGEWRTDTHSAVTSPEAVRGT